GTSQTTREDLADVDAALRPAVLIGRRLQDPLAELVRVDATTLNLAQYQHDVDEAVLKQKLDEVLESCVSEVGVDANAAPAATLRYVAGIGATQAAPVVEARKAKGGFKSREDLKDLPGTGPKTFEHAAGFLRIKDSSNPLDVTAIHPEAYAAVEAMAASVSSTVKDLLGNAELIARIEPAKFKTDTLGDAALKDIIEELKQPGRDVRGAFVKPEFNPELRDIKDLKEGMTLSGIVTNLTAFGAFVDIGVHQDGLVHISAITHNFIRDASEAVTVGQHVKVKVLSVDAERKRISLSMKDLEPAPKREPRRAQAGSGPRPAGGPRPPRPPRAAGAPTGGGAPREGAAQGSAERGPRPPRRDFRPRGPRPESAPAAAAVGAAAPAAGAPPAEGAAAMPRRFRERPQREGAGGRRDDRERQPRAKPVAPGKPDYSKFFVKGKGPKRDDKDKKRDSRPGDGASREEVREIMRKQNSGGTTLADLLKKAGVATDE
ncbi:MAG TPA: S1 RNA-binding domain-containing protein, partial [Planctomycetota bacterium]|nr:S1 RNA-binding domain-containing protein [Planctomycetota bacterium]